MASGFSKVFGGDDTPTEPTNAQPADPDAPAPPADPVYPDDTADPGLGSDDSFGG